MIVEVFAQIFRHFAVQKRTNQFFANTCTAAFVAQDKTQAACGFYNLAAIVSTGIGTCAQDTHNACFPLGHGPSCCQHIRFYLHLGRFLKHQPQQLIHPTTLVFGLTPCAVKVEFSDWFRNATAYFAQYIDDTLIGQEIGADALGLELMQGFSTAYGHPLGFGSPAVDEDFHRPELRLCSGEKASMALRTLPCLSNKSRASS